MSTYRCGCCCCCCCCRSNNCSRRSYLLNPIGQQQFRRNPHAPLIPIGCGTSLQHVRCHRGPRLDHQNRQVFEQGVQEGGGDNRNTSQAQGLPRSVAVDAAAPRRNDEPVRHLIRPRDEPARRGRFIGHEGLVQGGQGLEPVLGVPGPHRKLEIRVRRPVSFKE